MDKQPLKLHLFVFNQKDNGGESLTLITQFFSNGDPGAQGIFSNQELTLQSYCNSASFNLCGIQITPELLRKLADELVEVRLESIASAAAMELAKNTAGTK